MQQIIFKNNKNNIEKNINIKSSHRNLIESCWNEDPEKRPSFEQIFNMLALNKEYINGNYEKDEENPNKYFLDNVNIQKINSYINYITKNDFLIDNETNNNTIISLNNEINEFENCTIDDFNEFSIKEQYSFISQIISKTNQNNTKCYLVKIKNLLTSKREYIR